MAKKTTTRDAKRAEPQRVVKVSAEDLPRRSIADAQRVVDVIYRNYATNAVSWPEIAKLLDVSPKNNENRYPVWAAVAYGMLTKTDSDTYEVAETGRKIVAPEYDGDDVEGKAKALLTPRILSKFFTDFNGHSLPESAHFPNVLENRYEVPRNRTGEAISLIRENGNYAGVLHEDSEGRRVVRLDRVVAPASSAPLVKTDEMDADDSDGGGEVGETSWDSICFFITPIGDEGSNERRHSDMILKHVVGPAAKEHSLEVIRADKIERSDLITQQVFEQLARAKVCVADLSFMNENVFYELGVRHTCKLPAVQLIRKGDKIPFDVAQGRTITIDTTDIYSIADRLSSAQRELSQHLKHILSATQTEPSEDNPVHLYLPKLKVTM